jgi:hypothetical protein
MKKYAHNQIYKEESRLFYIALISCIFVFFTYIYFVSTSIADVVLRKEIDEKINERGTYVSTLEAEYIEMQHSVSNDIATHRGFLAVDSKIFIDKNTRETLVMQSK